MATSWSGRRTYRLITKKRPLSGAAQTSRARYSLTVLIHILRHLEMVRQGRQGFARPVFQLRIIATLRITLKERHRILVSADLHRIIFTGEVFRLTIRNAF